MTAGMFHLMHNALNSTLTHILTRADNSYNMYIKVEVGRSSVSKITRPTYGEDNLIRLGKTYDRDHWINNTGKSSSSSSRHVLPEQHRPTFRLDAERT